MTSERDAHDDGTGVLREALVYLEACHWPLLAIYPVIDGRCGCGDPKCERAGKHPIEMGWQKHPITTEVMLRAFLARYPRMGLGLVTGRVSRVLVIDVDGAEGEVTLAELERRYGPLPKGPEVRTARGRHLYFEVPENVLIKGTVGEKGRGLGRGLDVRCEGNYVVLPPSVHVTGHVYGWTEGTHPGMLTMPGAPEWLVTWLTLGPPRRESTPPPPPPSLSTLRAARSGGSESRGERWSQGALEAECELVRSAPEGTRNATLNRAAFKLATIERLDLGEAGRALLEAARVAGLSEFEARKTIRSGFEGARANGHARSGPEQDAPTNGAGPHAYAGHAEGPATGGGALPPEDDEGRPELPRAPSRIEVVGPQVIFAPLPPMNWALKGLSLGQGRPMLVAGYGASAKTLAMQSMAVAIAAGRPVWGHFACEPLKVLHFDFEMGDRDTFHRYQRIARGMGIAPAELEGRLFVNSAPMRQLYTTSDGAEAEYTRLIREGDFHLVIIDSLRASAPGVDENASSVREFVDMWTRISLSTGAAIVIIHHSGKATEGRDQRALARGSSAIFDASGAVLNLSRRDVPGTVTRVHMAKSPTSVHGEAAPDFDLVVEDVALEDDATAGVRVVWRAVDPDEEAVGAEGAERPDVRRARLRALVEGDARTLAPIVGQHPGIGERELRAAVKVAGEAWGRDRLDAAKARLALGLEGQRLVNRATPRRPAYHLVGASTPPEGDSHAS